MGHNYTEMVDSAQELQIANNEKAIKAVQDRLAPESHPDFDGVHCIDCAGDVHEARLAMGRIRCIKCQEAKERGSKLFRR